MKRIALVTAMTVFALAFFGSRVCGQENTATATFTVRGSEVSTGVVIVSGQITSATARRTAVELQCNKGVSLCVAPPAGTYVMVRLPKNRGTYDCANVELYPNGADPEKSDKIGAYCLIEK
jgi:hypothetical protein